MRIFLVISLIGAALATKLTQSDSVSTDDLAEKIKLELKKEPVSSEGS